MTLTVLDCTLRDGGYYNNWNFTEMLVQDYLNAMVLAGIDVVEIGFRSPPRSGFHGPFAYSTDRYLEKLKVNEALKLAVMLDAKSVLENEGHYKDVLNKLFVESNNSKVDVVRVAVNFDKATQCRLIVEHLKSLGYIVVINLMQSGGREVSAIEEVGGYIRSWGVVDVVYFADSIGNMAAEDIDATAMALHRGWQGKLGLHAHNNMGQANDNCFSAMNVGVEWIDATVTGMGRGAGNAQTEILLNNFSNERKYDPKPVYQLALEYFMPMQKELGWGSNFVYYYSAINNIHPTYAQELLSDKRYTPEHIITALRFLSEREASSFSSQLVQQAFDDKEQPEINGEWDASGWCKDRDILLVGAGPSVKKYAAEIEELIKRNDLITISVNYHSEISEKYINRFVAAEPKRLSLDVTRYKNSEKPVVLPKRVMSGKVINELGSTNVLDFDMKITEGCAQCFKTGCEIPYRLTVAYSLCLCKSGEAARVFLVGFDGYPADDPRQLEMLKTIEILKPIYGDTDIISLTPTTYPVIQRSLYAPYL